MNRKTFSINIPGSGTHSLSEKILALHGIVTQANPQVLALSSAQGAAALLDGKIDGVFLVAGIESQAVMSLSADGRIKVLDFVQAEAYVRRLKFLEPLTLPRGGLNLEKGIPRGQRHLVASTTTVLTKSNLHPAIQYLFLSTAKKLDRPGSTFFTREGGFPAFIARDVPISQVAEHYYDKGEPALIGHVPFWLAVFFEQVWFILFAILAIFYPIFKLIPHYRVVYTELCMSDCFSELKELDSHLREAKTPHELQQRLEHFDRIETRVHKLWVPAAAREGFYNLRNALEILRMHTERMKQRMELQQASNGAAQHAPALVPPLGAAPVAMPAPQ